MYLFVHGYRLLKDIREEFQASFPYLQIRFDVKDHSDRDMLDEESAIGSETLLRVADIGYNNIQAMLPLEDTSQINELQQWFISKFGIHVRVFHFTSAGWIPATILQTATLGELNEQGRQLFHEIHHVNAQPGRLL